MNKPTTFEQTCAAFALAATLITIAIKEMEIYALRLRAEELSRLVRGE